MVGVDLVTLLIGLLWGFAFVVVNHIFGEEKKFIFRLIASHVIIVMAVVYTLLSVDGSVIAAGAVTLLVLALAEFIGFPKNDSNQV
ncbi:hypothetical protein [Natrialba asiatica]|uniref:EamA domain-containing protein n=1 Tax=Natrialba asiatica (strain ATCC 700177 / DSM 12278 / JCM 9576 / FERM P-10747 / NBRC 102637 / 172P1) TaxID=29540 RepID=M0AFM3_NATA1|nr:hypothetical protein [Natrialba asiatica]ELY97201.1 hypothetical protein C481_20576 [Natrialba asiatica DSM 12278]